MTCGISGVSRHIGKRWGTARHIWLDTPELCNAAKCSGALGQAKVMAVRGGASGVRTAEKNNSTGSRLALETDRRRI